MKIGVIKWSSRISVSIVDQGLYSTSNFLLNILLARWLSPENYGAYSIGFTILLFVSGFHNAIILEPMSVLGPSNFQNNLISYFQSLLKLHWLITIVGSIIGIIVSIFVIRHVPSLGEGLVGAFIGMPFILFFWLARRICYIYQNPKPAAIGSLSYMIILSSIFLLRYLFPIHVLHAFLVMAASSMLSSLVILSSIPVFRENRGRPISIDQILTTHWQYGRWVVGSAFVYWINNSIYVPALGLLLGLVQSGIFRAMQNFTLPVQQIGAAVNLLFTPWLARQRFKISADRFIQKSRIISLGFFIGGLTYSGFIIAIRTPLANIFYSNSDYTNFIWLVVPLGISSLFEQISNGLSVSLRAIQKPNSIFWAQTGGAVISITVGILLIWQLGLIGAGIGVIMSSVVNFLILIWHYDRFLKPASVYLNHDGEKLP